MTIDDKIYVGIDEDKELDPTNVVIINEEKYTDLDKIYKILKREAESLNKIHNNPIIGEKSKSNFSSDITKIINSPIVTAIPFIQTCFGDNQFDNKYRIGVMMSLNDPAFVQNKCGNNTNYIDENTVIEYELDVYYNPISSRVGNYFDDPIIITERDFIMGKIRFLFTEEDTFDDMSIYYMNNLIDKLNTTEYSDIILQIESHIDCRNIYNEINSYSSMMSSEVYSYLTYPEDPLVLDRSFLEDIDMIDPTYLSKGDLFPLTKPEDIELLGCNEETSHSWHLANRRVEFNVIQSPTDFDGNLSFVVVDPEDGASITIDGTTYEDIYILKRSIIAGVRINNPMYEVYKNADIIIDEVGNITIDPEAIPILKTYGGNIKLIDDTIIAPVEDWGDDVE